MHIRHVNVSGGVRCYSFRIVYLPVADAVWSPLREEGPVTILPDERGSGSPSMGLRTGESVEMVVRIG